MRVMKSKKAEWGFLRKAIVAVIIIGIFLLIFPTNINSGVSKIQLAQCMKTYDYDGDGAMVDDSCPCDPGQREDQKTYYLEGSAQCLIVPNSDDTFEYKLKDDTCKDRVAKALRDASDCKTSSVDKGFTLKCLNEIAQQDPKTDAPAKVCPTPTADCEKFFKESEVCKNG